MFVLLTMISKSGAAHDSVYIREVFNSHGHVQHDTILVAVFWV